MKQLHQAWSTSKIFRVILVVAFIYASLRLATHVWMMSERMLPGQSDTQFAPIDLQIHIDATHRLQNHESLYVWSNRIEIYQYPPVFALAITPFFWLPQTASVILQFLLRLVGYGLLYMVWGRIFQQVRLKAVSEMWIWTLPVWLVFSAFWSDLAYMNIYILTALFATFFISAILDENLLWSAIWFTVLFQTKPHWAFALGVPFLLGQWRFLGRLLLTGIILNAAVIGIFLLIVGPSYGWQQHIDFVYFLAAMRDLFPWRVAADGFLGYNHSITQIVVFLSGLSATTLRLATIFKVILLTPLLVVCGRYLLQPVKRAAYEIPKIALALAFSLYLGVFIWMDMVWELSLGIVVFVYLLGTLESRPARGLVWLVFLPYALVDFWQFVSYGIWGDAIFNATGYVLTDPTIYFPLVMIVILIFYGILLRQLWDSHPAAKTIEAL